MKRKADRRFKIIISVLLIAIIASGCWIVAKRTHPGGLINKPSASDSTGTEKLNQIKTASEPKPVADPIPAESTDINVLKSSWESSSVFNGKNAYPEYAFQNVFTNGNKMPTWIFRNNTPLKEYTPKDKIEFGSSGEYSVLEGVTAFRGNNYRNSPSFGTRTVKQKKLEIVWEQKTGAISAHNSFWPGAGWTGQPLLIHWPQDVRNIMNIKPEMKSKDLVEVIYPILDGNIYFLDLETGKPTRDKIHIGFPIKGTAMVDPRGYPVLYTGMGINDNSGKFGEYKYRIINLLNQKELYTIFGRDETAFRGWGANDSSALLDRNTDTLFNCGENGLVYKVKLNTNFDKAAGTLTMAPQLTKYRYRSPYTDEQGIESSPAIYKNYMYFNDNGGNMQCLDINTMKPVWIYNTEDDSDSSTVIEDSKDGVALYTANEVDKRSDNGKNKYANCNIRKIDALTGKLLWQKDYQCLYNYYINGGAIATPVLGKDDISDIVIYNIAFTTSTNDGILVALNKKTGEEVWKKKLSSYSWSSPVDFKSTDGKTYVVYCDFSGRMYLIDPKTGETLDSISLGRNVEASPAIYNDTIVVGSYAQKIFGIKVR
jgi:outer membrane protein assembly factor BamB